MPAETAAESAAVIGAGTMGRGIIETAACHGLHVHAVESDPAQQSRAMGMIANSVARAIRRGKISAAQPDDVLGRIAWHADPAEAVQHAAFVIEAIPEHEETKLELFRRLDALCPPGAVLASNTSSISISRLAAATGRPADVVGMHFFNPVPVMAPVEIVRGAHTSDDTVERTRALAETMGKQAFVVQDRPGFVVNRVLMPLINEAAHALHTGVAEARTIDALMKLGCNHPMGPLELADFVGLDVCLSILQVLRAGLDDAKFEPCPLLVELVGQGKLGRKSGEGFYKYGREE